MPEGIANFELACCEAGAEVSDPEQAASVKPRAADAKSVFKRVVMCKISSSNWLRKI